ncbi:MAG: hypothetical protein LKF53_06215 [Solobacterium sp.]|nr:hypothetical protein [Solobacterium sp.]MCH4205969.1 hypothetical protein [Solobacterium sp.]MCH4227423.1 hypothetical protein [Solobacterium sp.]MCH4282792.1 hypothetical protein [Solobacterium sp.]
MKNVFDVILLTALPASGKSEIRNFMAHMEPKDLQSNFHIGQSLQLDDFPYVVFMQKIDMELDKLGLEHFCSLPNGGTFIDVRTYGVLSQMLSEDYHDLKNRVVVKTDRPAEYMFNRIDRARQLAGMEPVLSMYPSDIRAKLIEAMNPEAEKDIAEKNSQYPDSFDNKTIIIECARGGKQGSEMPLTGSTGYQYYFKNLAPDLLSNAAVLYVQVTPEESRRKNAARFDPNDPDSSLFHSTPEKVMLNDYGCDDMQYLLEHTEVKDTVTVKNYGRTWHVPAGVIDNRSDMTSFLRADAKEWKKEDINTITNALKATVDTMWKNYNKD